MCGIAGPVGRGPGRRDGLRQRLDALDRLRHSGERREIPEDWPEEARQGRTDFDETVYGGPSPTSGEHTHVFRMYALDEPSDPFHLPTTEVFHRSISVRSSRRPNCAARTRPSGGGPRLRLDPPRLGPSDRLPLFLLILVMDSRDDQTLQNRFRTGDSDRGRYLLATRRASALGRSRTTSRASWSYSRR